MVRIPPSADGWPWKSKQRRAIIIYFIISSVDSFLKGQETAQRPHYLLERVCHCRAVWINTRFGLSWRRGYPNHRLWRIIGSWTPSAPYTGHAAEHFLQHFFQLQSHNKTHRKYLLPLTTMPAFIFKFKLLVHIILYLDWLGSLLCGIFLLIIYKVNYSNLWHNKLLPAPLANLEPPRPLKCVRTQIQPLHCHAATLQNR